jgi:hypothetical protein
LTDVKKTLGEEPWRSRNPSRRKTTGRGLASMPNALRVSVNLAHAVKRDSMDLSFEVRELECLWTAVGKCHLL